MESKHKNALIGALLAVVFVMAVGYAAFAQLLTINGTATIDSSWDVHFDPSQTSSTGVAVVNGGGAGATAPSGTIAYNSANTTATLSASLQQPSDTVTFTLKPTNYGSLSAKPAAAPVITTTDDNVTVAQGGQSATTTNIKWEIVSADTTVATNHTLTGANGTTPVPAASQDTIVVKASFTGGQNESVQANQSASIQITINYVQA